LRTTTPRTLAACLLPALAVSVSWLRLEQPPRVGETLAVVALALAPALVPRRWLRGLAAVAATAGGAWVAFAIEPWELLPFRDQRVLAPLVEAANDGFGDFYRVVLPLDPTEHAEMHALVLAAIFGFVLASALLVAASRPVAAAAVAVAGAGWPSTLVGGNAVALGALALAAALSIPLLLRVRSGPSLVAGVTTAAVVVAGAAWASSATTVAREAVLNWESWDLHGVAPRAQGVRFAWNANYDGVEFPPTKTVVLTVEGPDTARYWRTSTLDLFADDHWIEHLGWWGRVDGGSEMLRRDAFTPARALREENWLEQRIEVKALVDDRLAAAGTPVRVDSRRLGIVFRYSGGVLRVLEPLGAGQRYRVWSYAPDPAPAALAASKPRYPAAADRYQTLVSSPFPDFGVPGRDAEARALLSDPSYESLWPYRSLYTTAERVVRDAATPYETVLALESWFRRRGGFRYDESPPEVSGAPLVGFVNRTRAGYCQHYAGAMALMLRMLGIPSRVAVGFTSGRLEEGKWIVTDHEAHAWVEVWFAGQGWVPFDPTPGRATFGGKYSYASDSEAAVAALDRGDLSGSTLRFDRDRLDRADLASGAVARDEGPSFFGLALVAGALWAVVLGVGKAVQRRLRYLTRDPRQAATASRRELEAFLRDQGIAVSASATLEDLRRIVGEELGLDCRMYAEAAARARFGPPEECRGAADAARDELRKFLKRVRFELSVWARFRGFVSLRSLWKGWQA
jgi:transglutaminase-like putative cysteine protease